MLASRVVRAAARPLARALSGAKAPKPALHAACETGDAAAVKKLLSEGHDAAAPDGMGTPPLHVAVRCGHDDVVNTLLAHGASASAPAANTWAYTPLQYAAIFGQQSVASTLLAAPGIELLAKDGRGETALDHAVGERQWAVAHLIADALDAAGALDAAPAVAAQVAQLREGAKAAAPAAELTPAERVRRNQEILAARKASRESN